MSVALALGLDVARQVVDRPRSEVAARLAVALHQVGHGDPQVRRVTPGDTDAQSELTTQLSSMVTFLAHARHDRRRRPDVVHAMKPTFSAFVDFSPGCVHASLSRTRKLLATAQWATTVGDSEIPVQRYQPNEGQPSTTDHTPTATEEPRLLTALAEADAVAGPGRSPVLAPRATPTPDTGPSATDVLAELNQDESRPATALALDALNSLTATATSPRQLETFIERAVQIDEPQRAQPRVPSMSQHYTAELSMSPHSMSAGVGLH